ncbi:MAG: GNAT family N-acetyltransferase [Chloroflexi bacterium]|nr:GNAT family N-acetyltransferase [Chloroflexota bacterium]
MKAADIQYRRATEEDLGHISKLLTSVRGDRTGLSARQFLVACASGLIIGCGRIKQWPAGEKELASLAVAVGWRKRGVGSTLVSKLSSEEKSRPLYLLCSPAMTKFYAPHGFHVVGEDELPLPLRGEQLRIIRELAVPIEAVVAMALI